MRIFRVTLIYGLLFVTFVWATRCFLLRGFYFRSLYNEIKNSHFDAENAKRLLSDNLSNLAVDLYLPIVILFIISLLLTGWCFRERSASACATKPRECNSEK